MFSGMKEYIQKQLSDIRDAGLYKGERVLAGPQGPWVKLSDGRKVLVLCSNNYLGLSGHPDIIAAAKAGIDGWGNGLSSVRFICGAGNPQMAGSRGDEVPRHGRHHPVLIVLRRQRRAV